MERIVQITDWEYNKLVENARLKEKEIEKRASDLYKKNGTFQVLICIDTPEKDYKEKIYFKFHSHVPYSGNEKIPIKEVDRKRIEKVFNRLIEGVMIDKFGKQICDINYYTKKTREIEWLKIKLIGVTICGWLTALALLFVD